MIGVLERKGECPFVHGSPNRCRRVTDSQNERDLGLTGAVHGFSAPLAIGDWPLSVESAFPTSWKRGLHRAWPFWPGSPAPCVWIGCVGLGWVDDSSGMRNYLRDMDWGQWSSVRGTWCLLSYPWVGSEWYRRSFVEWGLTRGEMDKKAKSKMEDCCRSTDNYLPTGKGLTCKTKLVIQFILGLNS